MRESPPLTAGEFASASRQRRVRRRARHECCVESGRGATAQVLDSTFAMFQLDSAGEISWRAFERYYAKHPQQAQLLVHRLGFNINRLTAAMWLRLPDVWMAPERGSSVAGPAVELQRGYMPGDEPTRRQR